MEYYNTDFALSTPPVVTELPPPPSSGASGPGAGEPVLRAPAEPVRSRPGALRPASVYGILVAIRRSDSQKMADMSGGGSPRSRRSGIRPGGCPGDPVSDAVTAFCEEVLDYVSPRLLTRSRMRVRISPWFPVLLCAFYRLDPVGCFWPFLGAAAIHEAGHCLAVLLCGGSIHSLALTARGAVLQTSPLSYRQEALCALAGPCAGFCCSFGSAWFPGWHFGA